eukprot:9486245-Pyramimonas_sp.AAC.2
MPRAGVWQGRNSLSKGTPRDWSQQHRRRQWMQTTQVCVHITRRLCSLKHAPPLVLWDARPAVPSLAHNLPPLHVHPSASRTRSAFADLSARSSPPASTSGAPPPSEAPRAAAPTDTSVVDAGAGEEEMSEAAGAELSGRKRKMFELRLKMNQARKANHQAVVAEKKRVAAAEKPDAEGKNFNRKKYYEQVRIQASARRIQAPAGRIRAPAGRTQATSSGRGVSPGDVGT